MRRAIFLTDPEIDRNNLVQEKGERTSGTCEWITEDTSYQAWLEGKTKFLWICGGPGKGKTMLSIYLTQELESKPHFLYYFCNGQDHTRNNAAAVLRTLIWQVLERHEEAAQHLARYLNNPSQEQATLASPGTLWNLFMRIAKDVVAKSDLLITCLVDGIDECDPESTRWLCDKFMDFCCNSTNSSLLRLVVISRQISGLSRASKIELDSSTNWKTTADVSTFISKSVQELAVERHLTANLCERIGTMLYDKAEGTFLWVGFALQELRTSGTGLEMLRALESMPKGLSASYQAILRRIEARGSAKSASILHWVAMAYRPLFLDELAAAAECEPFPSERDLDVICDEVAICAPLLEVRQGSVVLVHQSALDYLIGAQEAHVLALRKYSISHEDAHFYLARRCLRSLPWYDDLTDYATEHWLTHAKQLHALAYQLVVQEPSFFGSNPSVRDAWWSTSSKPILAGSHSPLYHAARPSIPRLHMACYLGLWAWVELIFTEESPTSHQHCLQMHDKYGRTPLLSAILVECLEVIERLSNYGANLNETFQVHRNHWYQVTNVSLIPNCYPSFWKRASLLTKEIVQTPLLYAVRLGRYESAKLLIQCGANINVTTHGQSSPLTVAVATKETPGPVVSHSHPEHDWSLVLLLLRSGADPNLAGSNTTPLCAAAMSGQEMVARILLDWGANPNGTSAEPCTRFNSSVAFTQWREGGLGGPSMDQNFTAMHLAAGNGHAGIVKLLTGAERTSSPGTAGERPL